MSRNIAVAGIAATPMDDAPVERPRVAPTSVEMHDPDADADLEGQHQAAAHSAGRARATYIGTTCVPPPTAKPSRIRLSDSVNLSGAIMQQIAPAKKITAMMRIVPRRPRSSESGCSERADDRAQQDARGDQLLPRAADVEVVFDLQQRARDDPGVVAVEHGGDRRNGGGQIEPSGQGVAAACACVSA